MLLDVLGILVGFAAVMLLLSLIVTTLVQLIQHVLGMRSRNLGVGIQALLETVLKSGPGEQAENARKVLTEARFVPRKASRIARMVDRVTSPSCTWIEPKELVARLKGVGLQLDESQQEQINQAFDRMGDYLRARFVQHVRVVTIILAFLVAFCFQVSTPALLRDLSTDPELRARYATAAETLVREGELAVEGALSYQDVSEEALRVLQERHPELAAQFEQAGGIGENRADIVAELDLILAEDLPQKRDPLVEEYEQLLTTLHATHAGESLQEARRLVNALARFNITPWAEGWAYYTGPDGFENWIGVILTTILLTLGAPFWFNTLRSLVNLRDQLQPESKKGGRQNGDASGAQGGQGTNGRRADTSGQT
ncbi:MAG: hypothetical protein AMJ38_00360 [Dehalococcoidia bacterium DG_22]|nr:MAG: hypothetical protein AMJ38_00360 [Dehalococcoidia bacterium DG_22]